MKAILLDEAKKWLEENCENQYTRMAVFGIMQSMPTVDYQKTPNDPLTLDQLRKMKDEPAYLKVFDPRLESGWHIIKAVTEDKIIFRGWQTVYVPIDGMGIDYNLYRRPPEEIGRAHV